MLDSLLGARRAHGLAAWEGGDDPLTRAEADALRNTASLFGVPLIEWKEDPG